MSSGMLRLVPDQRSARPNPRPVDPNVPQQLQVNLDWSAVNEMPMSYATTFACTVPGPGEVLLLVGQAVAPVFPGTPAQQQEAMRRIKSIAVTPVAKIMINPVRLQELITALQDIQKIQGGLPAGTFSNPGEGAPI